MIPATSLRSVNISYFRNHRSLTFLLITKRNRVGTLQMVGTQSKQQAVPDVISANLRGG